MFPIPPGGTRTVEIEYVELLIADGGLVSYRHPFGAELPGEARIEHLAVSVEVTSTAGLRAVYSPSHDIALDRPDDHHFTASYESGDAVHRDDFVLFYSTSDSAIGANLLTFRGGDEDGYFLLLVAPGVDVSADQAVAKDVVLVLDRSGSMEGEKFEQAIDAARFVIGHLNDDDHFNLITFSSSLDTLADGLIPATEVDRADQWLGRQFASGSTDINRALLEAVGMFSGKRPGYLIFLTDGLPTRGEQDPDRIIANVSRSAPEDLALFAFGVGFDVDTVLLDTLAEQHRGTTSYVVPGERIDETVSAFYAKVNTPVLTGVDSDVDGPAIRDLQPSEPGDVFAGEQLAIVGRYHGHGDATIRISGEGNGRPVTFTYRDLRFRSAGGADFLPRLWATRKIGALLGEIRIHGPNQELIEEVVAISTRYGVVTPYTSFLVTEPIPLTADDVRRIAENQLSSGALDFERSGEEAVTYSASARALGNAAAPASIDGDTRGTVRVTGNRAFTLIDGVWVDTTFDVSGTAPLRVAYLSDDYFALAESRADLAAALAIGQRVIVVVDGVAYEVVAADEVVDPFLQPAPVDDQMPVRSPTSAVSDGPVAADAEVPASPSDSDLSVDASTVDASGDPSATIDGGAADGRDAARAWWLVLAALAFLTMGWWWTRRRGSRESPPMSENAEPQHEDVPV